MNTKKLNFKKIMMNIILIFIALLVLPGFISSLATESSAAYTYSFKSVSGEKTWSVSSNASTDAGVAELYYYLSQTDPEGGNLPTYGSKMTERNFQVGTNLSVASGSETSLNRAGCFCDCANKETALNVVCSHESVDTIESTENTTINQMLFITPNDIKFYKLTLGGKIEDETISDEDGYIDGKINSYNYQGFLAVAFASQYNCETAEGKTNYSTAEHFAKYISQTPKWRNNINNILDNDIEFWDTSKYPDERAIEYKDWAADMDNYEYSGVFVFYSIGAGQGQGRMAWRIVRKEKVKDVEVNFKKQDFNGTNLTGAEIEITADTNVKSISATKLTIGKSGSSITVKPIKNANNQFTIKIKETKVPEGYIGMPEEVTLTVTYDASTGAVKSISSNDATYVPSITESKTDKTVIIKNRPVVKMTFEKQDFNGNNISGATIVVKGYEDTVSKFIGRNEDRTLNDSNKDGIFDELTIYPADDSGTFKLKVEETPPEGFLGVPGHIILTVTYDISTGKIITIDSDNETYIPDRTEENAIVIIKNQPVLSNLKIVKKDSLTGNVLAGVTFIIELTGVSDIDGYSGTPSIITTATDSSGEINLNGLVLATDATQMKVKITESGVPYTYEKQHSDGYYYKVDKTPIEFTITYNNGSWSVSGGSVKGTSISSDNATISGKNVSINIANQPYITLSGKVWQDGQTGNKNVAGPDGKRNNGEKGLKDVYVRLYDVGTENRTVMTVNTDADGNYSFVDIPKTNDGYRVIFNYDGINYQEINSLWQEKNVGKEAEDSKTAKVDETGKYEYYKDAETTTRADFDNRFKTVSKDKITSSDGTTVTPIKYNYESKKGYIVDIAMDGTNPAATDQNGIDNKDFQMRSRTGIYYNTTENLDCGLVRKVFDLGIGTDVKDATLTINDKSTTYEYAQVMNGALEDLTLDNILQNHSDIIYNLYLEYSDYRFRIEDYRENKEKILNNVYPSEFEEKDTTKELQAFVKYSVILKNQSTYEATVDEFVYYYDSVYTPEFKKDDVISGYKVKSIETENNKITFERVEDNLLSKGNDYRKEIELTFRVNKDENGIILKDNISNVAEITKYTTVKGGLIDADSAPDNANVTLKNGTPKIGYDEDDSDEAPGLKISIKNDSRTVSGIVTDDKDGDGILEASENKINGVVVQLIELHEVDVNGDRIIDGVHEYIWQETKTGSNKVVCTPRNGYSDNFYTYENSVTESDKGKFEFKNFIPGNYIIRYIYGDVPRCYSAPEGDIETTKKYNGQDYKSTIDTKYNVEWYNGAGYTKGQSVARDNEARRLQVMAHSAMVNEEMYKTEQNKIKEKIEEGWTEEKAETWKYHFTWMAAETSKLNVTIDNKVATTSNSTDVSYNDIKDDNTVKFTDMDFGITLRPQNKLVLEKHITGLKIGQEGVQEVVDAKANIEKIMENGIVEATGLTKGLATVKSDRKEIGMWKIEMDIEELTQGSTLEAEYTYVIKNEGQEDYLSAFLVNEYEKGNITEYINVLNTKAQEVKGYTRCNTHEYNKILGEFYYTGEKASTDKLVTSRVEEIEECINNQLNYQKEIAGADFKKTNTSPVKANIYDSDGNLKETDIDTVVSNVSPTKFLNVGEMDYSKTLTLTRDLSSITNGEMEGNYPSYIAEVKAYSNAAGRIDMEARISNLSYVHSDDKTITLDAYVKKDGSGNVIDVKYEPTEGYVKANEYEEFWAERIIISEPTGQNKVTPILLTIVIISAIAVMGSGIILIKKFVLNR